ncbi:MAG TPA: WG repeat-containing protein [Pyrinomonadaceae bacterium]
MRPIQLDGKWGYVDKTGKIVIKPQFVWAEEFSEGLASFESENGKYGYVDERGEIVIEPKFTRWSEFSEGVAAVAINFKWGFIDKRGEIVIPLQYAHAFSFSGGIAPVSLFPPEGESWTPGREATVYIDKPGKTLIDAKENFLNVRASSGLAVLQLNDKQESFLIDKNGNKLVEAENIDLAGFGDGLIAVKKNKKWGYVDKKGKFVIEPQFEEARKFYENLALVQVGEQWGFINLQGKLAIPAKFDIGWEDENHNFSEGLALVYFKDRCVYINQTGKIVFKIECSEAGRFIGGLALVKTGDKSDEKRGYIDKAGKYVWGPSVFKYKDLQTLIKKNQEKQEKEENEKLTPLSEEEKRLNFREIVANQPDFAADISFFYSEEFGGTGFSYRLARKGTKYRKESQFWIVVGETGKSRIRLNPSDKSYNDLESVDDETAGGATDFNPQTLADAENTFSGLGKIDVDGHECIKIEVKRKQRENEKIYLYAAKDLKNLIIAAQILTPPRALVQRLSNISLGVAENLVNVPPDYKPIERDVWKKVENAKVKFNGKFSKNFAVFRSPTGELFVSVDESNDNNPFVWQYLVRPKEAVVTIAFQGMLVTRKGEYVWRTKEIEAFSEVYYRNAAVIKEDKARGKSVQVQSNSIKFPTHFSDKVMIEIIF